MPVLTRAAFKAQKLLIPGFSLEDVLDEAGQVRRDVVEGVEVVDDENVELEDEEDSTNLFQLPNPSPSSPCGSYTSIPNDIPNDIPSHIPSLPSVSAPGHEPGPADPLLGLHGEERRKAKKKADKRARERSQRVEATQARELDSELRPRAVENAKNAFPNRISDFDSAKLPVASSGWVGNRNGAKLSARLLSLWRHLTLLTERGFRLLEWDGTTCIVLVDAQDRIMAVLAGVPPSAEKSGDWSKSMSNLDNAVAGCQKESSFAAKEEHHPRGDFTARAAGISYGGGRAVPGNVRISGQANQQAMEKLFLHPDMKRLVGFTNSIFNSFAHQTYVEYKETLTEHIQQKPQLRPTSPKTVFAATTVNFGPCTVTPPHLDAGNVAHGWCADTALGDYDPDKGGHLVLWNLKLVIRFPPGATILFPSALMTHSNIPVQDGEQRRSIVQYSAGGLFRWRYNGWCSDKTFLAKASKSELKDREQDRTQRWKVNLEKFTRWGDLVSGDWKGNGPSAAQLNEVGEQTNAEVERPHKRRRCK
ncbi:hypothetical protein BT96DRAFT_857967 [Gymnopus androsaceus JB14]|uniref:Uncharacterized protein n=1 Tax=Gymnopus androsaceus JB14 TaxID=1447944 RepID=A0A6A4HMZ9_9AGAR|nr:hypothetical protein BT96DRAFT_857967 [Gymnopus androsaceus JB14]